MPPITGVLAASVFDWGLTGLPARPGAARGREVKGIEGLALVGSGVDPDDAARPVGLTVHHGS